MENINTKTPKTVYVVTERLNDGRFAAKMYLWCPEQHTCESRRFGDVEIGVRNCRLVENVWDVTFSIPTDGFKPEVGMTYEFNKLKLNDVEYHNDMKNTGRSIAWKEPFITCISESTGNRMEVYFYIDELFDIVCKMKDASNECAVVDQSV